jgi:hypothetical protein
VHPHRLAEARSLAYHRLVAKRLATDPDLLARARARVALWLDATPTPPHHAREWAGILAQPISDIALLLEDDGERARELRQSTPFAGALDPRERWRLWREVADQARGIA